MVRPLAELMFKFITVIYYLLLYYVTQGGFARCYELTDVSTNQIMAGKIVPKALLKKPHQREKMAQEIDIHKSLSHHHIVKFFDYFEDNDFVYILLELCRRRVCIKIITSMVRGILLPPFFPSYLFGI